MQQRHGYVGVGILLGRGQKGATATVGWQDKLAVERMGLGVEGRGLLREKVMEFKDMQLARRMSTEQAVCSFVCCFL